MRTFTKFQDTARAIGVGNACLFAVSKLVHALFGERLRIIKYYFMAQPIALPTRSDVRSNAFSFAWIDAGCPLFSQVDRPPHVIAARFAQGARCLAAIAEEARLAGFIWLVLGPYEEDEVRARFCPAPRGTAVWDFDVMITPRYRMGRLFSYLWDRAGRDLIDKGIVQTVSRISAFNGASLAAHRRLGGRIVGEALFVCAGQWQLMKSSIAPKWHLSWRTDQRPTLEIGASSGIGEPSMSK